MNSGAWSAPWCAGAAGASSRTRRIAGRWNSWTRRLSAPASSPSPTDRRAGKVFEITRMDVPYVIPMAGPRSFFTAKIASNTRRDPSCYGATSSRTNRRRSGSSPSAAIRPCTSTSRKGTGCRYTERLYREVCRHLGCAFTQSPGPRVVVFRTTCPATQAIPSSLWRSSLLPGSQCCFVDEPWVIRSRSLPARAPVQRPECEEG